MHWLRLPCSLFLQGLYLLQATQDRQQIVRNGKASIQVTVRGHGTPIVFIPSFGRSVHDFDDLSGRPAKAGYQIILPEPRGIVSSAGPTTIFSDTAWGLARYLAQSPPVR